MSKRVKIISSWQSSIGEPADISKIREENRKREEDDKIRYKNEVEQEKIRINSLSCPLCNSNKKEHIVISINNGVLGPGRWNHIHDEYYVCVGCGIHFSDLNKKKIKKPFKSILF